MENASSSHIDQLVDEMDLFGNNFEDGSSEEKYQKDLHSENASISKDKATKEEDKEHVCTVCRGKFIYRLFNEHKTNSEHKRAKRLQKRTRHRTPEPSTFQMSGPTTPKQIKERYFFRKSTTVLTQQVEQYQKTLTTFLSLRFCLNNENKDVKISMNDNTWNYFGDIVIEIVNQENHTEIQAIQCKKIQNRNDMSLSSVTDDKGKLSLLRQLDGLVKLKNKNNYKNTFFKLFTLSKLKVDSNMTIVFDDDMFKTWQSETKKKLWKNKKLVVALFKKNDPINTTDDPDNICIFKILGPDGKILEDVEKDLCKFSLFMNQRKTLSLKHLIRMTIEDKFGSTRDISEEIVHFFSGYFNLNPVMKFHYKLTKRDVLLKIAELLLTPYILLSENTIEKVATDLWNNTLEKFDIVVIKNQPDTINKIYTSINATLGKNLEGVDSTMKTFELTKEEILDENLKSEIFDNPEYISRKVSLSYLYIALWKVQLAPLVLVVENEDNLSLIIKVINFLHGENLPLKFILATNKNIHPSYFPKQLKTFTNLEDLRKIDNEFMESTLDNVNIPFLNFSVTFNEIIRFNPDFLSKVTPAALLNMCFEDYAFKNIAVPLTDDIIDNTLILNASIMSKIRSYFWNEDVVPEVKNLSYLVNIDGCPTHIEVPPDI